MNHAGSNTEVAIIGMAGRFPGAPDVHAFWRNLCDGVESIRYLTLEELVCAGVEPAQLRNPRFVRASAFLDDVEWFDAPFFNISPREAELMDPQHRVFLECAWEALEQAGYAGEFCERSIGVYGGATINTYLICNLMQARELESVDLVQLNIGNSHDFLTTRVSYKLDLRGPSQTIQSACSTSLVAVHQACQGILHGECDMALAGGVSVNLKLRHGYTYTEGGMTSPDGHCRAFDKNAQGTIFGSGAGIVVLKKKDDALRDGDYIYAIIKGSAVNNDGSVKVGYTAPGVNGQAAVIREALANAGVDPKSIDYIEAHGTGTAFGDPIEIQALAKVFRLGLGKHTCGIGSVKTNIGHLDAAAGVTGLIKTVLALKHECIPATLHFQTPNPEIEFDFTPFYVVRERTDWRSSRGLRRAGVSAFGVGGTNAHVVLEQAPEVELGSCDRPWHLLMLSARSQPALEKSTKNLVSYLQQKPDVDITNVAYTLQTGRRRFAYRRFTLCADSRQGWEALQGLDPERVHTAHVEEEDRPIAFLFPGEGSQYRGMGRGLYDEEPAFRRTLEQCAEILKPELGLDLKCAIFPGDGQEAENADLLNQTWISQPALFVVEYALAQLLASWGVNAEAMVGHSVGEYVAACLAEVFSLEEALKLVALRGRLMQSLPKGAMLAAGLSESEAELLLGDQISLAAVSGPMQCVFSGEEEAIMELEQFLQLDGVTCSRLETSHAFQSHMVEPILPVFAEEVQRIKLRAPSRPYLSNITGQWITVPQATRPEYWVRHLRQTLRPSRAIENLLEERKRVLVEVGPGRTLTRTARWHTRGDPQRASFTTLSQVQPEPLTILLGELWMAGASIQWPIFYSRERRRRIPLPTYPFERQRYWIEPQKPGAGPGRDSSVSNEPLTIPGSTQVQEEGATRQDSALSLPAQAYPRPDLKTPYVAPRTELEKNIASVCTKVLGIAGIGVDDVFFDLGGDSLMALQVVAGLKEELGVDVPVVTLYEELTIRALASKLQFVNKSNHAKDAAALREFRLDRAARRKQYQQRERSKRDGIQEESPKRE